MSKPSSFTLKLIDGLKPADRQQWLTDPGQSGLQLCVTPAGAKTFYFYKWLDGKPHREKLGRYPNLSLDDARRLVRDRQRKADRGELLTTEGRTLTFDDAFRHYLEGHAKKAKRTWQEDQRKWDRELVEFHGRKLRTLTEADIQRFHNDAAETRGKVSANRALSLIKAVLNYAVKSPSFDYRGPNPAANVKKYQEQSRSRYLTKAEIGPFLAALKGERQVYQDLVLVLLLTAARLGNVTRMRWDEIDFDAAVWMIPMTKAGKAQAVPLIGPVMEILQRRKAEARGPWVFPSTRQPWRPVADVRKAWSRILTAAGLSNLTRHDLRRSMASWQAQRGESSLVIADLLGHAPGSKATAVYARLNVEPVRQALSRAADAMLIDQEPARPR